MKRTIFEDEHEALRETARQFLQRECAPYTEEWTRAGQVDRIAFKKAGDAGLLGFNIPEEYGGGGAMDDFRFNAVVVEEFAKFDGAAPGLSLQNDVVAPYFVHLANDEQKKRWMPGIATGETILAVAMTEPGAGSDLAGIKTSAKLEGDHYVLNGNKTFISSGINSDLVVVVCRTNPDPGTRGRGQHGALHGRARQGQTAEDRRPRARLAAHCLARRGIRAAYARARSDRRAARSRQRQHRRRQRAARSRAAGASRPIR